MHQELCIINPMHNLLLGTAKHTIEVWKQNGVLDSKCFSIIQQKVDSFIAPPDIGRVPSKISSGFSGFTADQWKNWTIFFSLFALNDIIERPHYSCWNLFVKACYLLCCRSITETQLQEGDQFLMGFCVRFAELYGQEKCTINMHLHGHLVECIEDFGPVYSFWCFAFERMNGILGSWDLTMLIITISQFSSQDDFLTVKHMLHPIGLFSMLMSIYLLLTPFHIIKVACNKKLLKQRFPRFH